MMKTRPEQVKLLRDALKDSACFEDVAVNLLQRNPYHARDIDVSAFLGLIYGMVTTQSNPSALLNNLKDEAIYFKQLKSEDPKLEELSLNLRTLVRDKKQYFADKILILFDMFEEALSDEEKKDNLIAFATRYNKGPFLTILSLVVDHVIGKENFLRLKEYLIAGIDEGE